MKDGELNEIEAQDVEDFLLKIEDSFDFKFTENELIHIKTFGEFCDHISNKITLLQKDDCTHQQAFYKLREAISLTLKFNPKTISPELFLSELLPRKNRHQNVLKIEKNLGFKLNILRPPYWVTSTFLITLFASLIGLFFNWKIGFLGFTISLICLWISIKTAKELDLKTVGQVAEKMTRENYLNSRRNPKTFNKNEIEKLLTSWFSDYFDLDMSKLTRESKFM